MRASAEAAGAGHLMKGTGAKAPAERSRALCGEVVLMVGRHGGICAGVRCEGAGARRGVVGARVHQAAEW